MICFPQLLHFVSQFINISTIHTRLNIYHRRYNGSKMWRSRSWKSARREISARQVHGTCVHVIPWPGKQDRSARLTYTVDRALFRVAEADSFVSVAGKRRTTGRLRTRDDPWIPTSENRQTGETQWPREDAAASMPSSLSLARTARGNAFYFILNKIFGPAWPPTFGERASAPTLMIQRSRNAITAMDMSWYEPDPPSR